MIYLNKIEVAILSISGVVKDHTILKAEVNLILTIVYPLVKSKINISASTYIPHIKIYELPDDFIRINHIGQFVRFLNETE